MTRLGLMGLLTVGLRLSYVCCFPGEAVAIYRAQGWGGGLSPVFPLHPSRQRNPSGASTPGSQARNFPHGLGEVTLVICLSFPSLPRSFKMLGK